MDFSTMRNKISEQRYMTMDDFEVDFDLVIKNCLSYNAKDTVFYRAALKMRDQVLYENINTHFSYTISAIYGGFTVEVMKS